MEVVREMTGGHAGRIPPVHPMPEGCEFSKCYRRTSACDGEYSVMCDSRWMCRNAAPPNGRAESLSRRRGARHR